MNAVTTTTPQVNVRPRRARPPFVALEGGFLRRSALASIVAALVVASMAALYFDPLWGWQYLLTALWALVFYTLTPLILKALMFDGRTLLGLGLMVGKLIWMGLIFWVISGWATAGDSRGVVVTGVLAGILTPLAVVSLRLIGRHLSGPQRPSTGKAEAPR
jgi:hypothetical protein